MDKSVNIWLKEYIQNIIKDNSFEFVDNIRIADTRYEDSILNYKNKQDTGCCGFFDDLIVCPLDNVKYMIGFNHGH